MPAEDIRHPEKQPNSSKGGRKKYKRKIGKKQHKFHGKKLSNGIRRDADMVNKRKG